jgi:hypothetical protein
MAITPYVPPAALSALPSGIWSGTLGNPVLPYLPGQAPVMKKSPLWSTKTNRAASGRERRTPFWNYPLWQFELAYEVVRHKPAVTELFDMWEFFNVQQGQFNDWLFVDPTDNQILVGAPAGTINTVTGGTTADGSTKLFQMTRPINSFIEPVYAVYSTTVLDNGGAAGTYTIQANGVINFSTAPTNGHTITWYGYFYFGCRFLQDDLEFEQIVNLLWQGKSLKFTSIRA